MKRVFSILCLFLFGIWFCVPVSAAGAPRAVMEAKDGVVRIFTYASNGDVYTGTGFAIANEKDGAFIVTNCHVVDGCDEYELYFNGQGPVELRIVAESQGQDLCVLRTERKLKGLRSLPLCTGKIESGQAVYTLGYPGSADYLAGQIAFTKEEMTVTNGLVSAIPTSYTIGTGQKPVKLIQTNADINSGNSGGPMLNEGGQVIGVNTVGIKGDGVSGMNGAVHVSELRGFLDVQDIAYRTGWAQGRVILAGIAAVLIVAALLAVWRYKKRVHLLKAKPEQAVVQAQAVAPNAVVFPGVQGGESLAAALAEKQETQEESVQPVAETTEAKPKRNEKWKWMAAIGISVFLLTVLGGGFSWYSYDTYSTIEDQMNYQNYAQALLLYQKAPWLEQWGDSRQKPYCEAMLAVQNYELESAIEKFKPLEDYRDCLEQIDLAQEYLEAENSEALVYKYNTFLSLGNYLDSNQKAEALIEEIYKAGLAALRKKEYRTAFQYFDALPEGYQERDQYVDFLGSLKRANRYWRSDQVRQLARQADLCGISIDEILLGEFLMPFLSGDWEGGWWYYSLDDDYYYTNIPISGVDAYRDSGFWKDNKKIVSIEYQDADHITMIYNNVRYPMRRVG